MNSNTYILLIILATILFGLVLFEFDFSNPVYSFKAKYIAERFSYSKKNFNCFDFSYTLAKSIDANMVHGFVDENDNYYYVSEYSPNIVNNRRGYCNNIKGLQPHAWVKTKEGLFIEATTGDFIDKSKIKKIKGKCFLK